MKTLSTALIFLMLSGSTSLIAQSQKSSLSAADRSIIQAWAEANPSADARIEGDRLILPADDRDNTCAFLRVYRMKRPTAGSDLTRPAGYTTCVSASRFTMKSSVIRSEQAEPEKSAPAR